MGYALKKPEFTAEDYLAWETEQAEKYEYVRGEVFAMAGGEDRHASAALNMALALRQHLRHTRCRVYMSDVKLRVDTANVFFYPDVFVTCSERDLQDRHTKRDAVLVVEVLSPSTAAYDRGDKFAAYRQLPSLQELLLIDLDRRSIDLFRRVPTSSAADHVGDLWLLHPLGLSDTLHLESVKLDVPVAEVLADLDDELAQAASTPST
jgi:Uma2 family endonuclease